MTLEITQNLLKGEFLFLLKVFFFFHKTTVYNKFIGRSTTKKGVVV